MEATGDRSAIVSASLPQLVQYSGQGFNQLHLPSPALHSVSLSLTPHPNHFSNPERCMFMPLCAPSLSAVSPSDSLSLSPPPLPPSFIDSSGSIADFLDSLDLTFRHCVHLLFISVNTGPSCYFRSMRRLSIGDAAWPLHLCTPSTRHLYFKLEGPKSLFLQLCAAVACFLCQRVTFVQAQA